MSKSVFSKAFIIFSFLLLSNFSWAYTLEFSEDQLQEKISAMMPVTKQTMLATIVVNDAKLDLIEGSDKLAITAKLKANALGNLTANGVVKIEGSLFYKASEGAFYLKDPKIVELNITQVPVQFHEQIKTLAQSGLAKSLAKRPVYKLKETDIKQSLAKTMLKSIVVKNQTLVATLGFF